MKHFYIQTYGCQMNVHDSERMAGLLEGERMEPADSYDTADVVIINTCAVREKPERKLFAELGRLKKLKKARPEMILGVAGCMAPRDADVIRSRAPYVDLIVGPRSITRLPDLVRKVELQRQPLDSIDLFDDPTPQTPVRRSSTISGWVDVMFGCNYACTYCAVPTARGAERSRLPGEILAEIAELTLLGYKEITLLGQTVNGYGRDFRYRHPLDKGNRERFDFTWLLREINKQSPNLRVRFTSPHPQLFTQRLIESYAELPSLCEHLHLPLQSGDNEVLKRMKRSYSVESYRQIVADLRHAKPGIAISTDIIVGFPGETEEQFQHTLDLYEDVRFDQAYMFIYSPRRHTEAFDYGDMSVPHDVAQGRLERLIATANRIAHENNERDVGKTFEVLVEGLDQKGRRLTGRTRTNKTVIFAGDRSLIGQLVPVLTEKAYLWGFEGSIS